MIEQDIEIALIEAKEGIEQSITKRGVIAMTTVLYEGKDGRQYFSYCGPEGSDILRKFALNIMALANRQMAGDKERYNKHHKN
tara:strand:- start:8147 stop:8395 length:249 start_codon:yes stop_codon:yes gene_type:complete